MDINTLIVNGYHFYPLMGDFRWFTGVCICPILSDHSDTYYSNFIQIRRSLTQRILAAINYLSPSQIIWNLWFWNLSILEVFEWSFFKTPICYFWRIFINQCLYSIEYNQLKIITKKKWTALTYNGLPKVRGNTIKISTLILFLRSNNKHD